MKNQTTFLRRRNHYCKSMKQECVGHVSITSEKWEDIDWMEWWGVLPCLLSCGNWDRHQTTLLKRLRKWIRLDPLSYLYKNISKNHNIFQYLLLHLHIFEDGVYPPGLGKHGSESCCVSNNEDPRPNLSEQQWDMKLCHVINWWSRLETTSDLTAICIFLQKFIQSSIMKHSKNKVLSDLFPISEALGEHPGLWSCHTPERISILMKNKM